MPRLRGFEPPLQSYQEMLRIKALTTLLFYNYNFPQIGELNRRMKLAFWERSAT